EAGFLEAVDLADWLAAHRGLSFREAYRVAAASVEACRLQGRLTFISVNSCLPAGCRSLSEKEFAEITDLRRCLARRDQVGAPSPRQAKRSVARIRGYVKRQQRWASQAQERLTDAEERLHRAVAEILR
ncbi:MAG TPA: hypothetical protein PKH07_12860, partial [bacterium]|nr:hypothetical protein [bacterium]